MKIQSKDYGAWYYMLNGIMVGVSPLPLLWVTYKYATDKEYWPILLFGVMTCGAWFKSYGMFRKAHEIRRSKNGSKG